MFLLLKKNSRWQLHNSVHQNPREHIFPFLATNVGLLGPGSYGSYNLNEYCKHCYFILWLLFFTDISDYFPQTGLLADLKTPHFPLCFTYPGFQFQRESHKCVSFNLKGHARNSAARQRRLEKRFSKAGRRRHTAIKSRGIQAVGVLHTKFLLLIDPMVPFRRWEGEDFLAHSDNKWLYISYSRTEGQTGPANDLISAG